MAPPKANGHRRIASTAGKLARQKTLALWFSFEKTAHSEGTFVSELDHCR
jgi:hypothetical protein